MIRGEVNQISELSYAKLVASVSAYSAKLRTSAFALRLQLCKLLTKKKLIFFFVLKFICADIYFAQLGCWYTQILTPWKRNYRNPLYYLGITTLEREKGNSFQYLSAMCRATSKEFYFLFWCVLYYSIYSNDMVVNPLLITHKWIFCIKVFYKLSVTLCR